MPKTVYFPVLDVFRFVASFGVVLAHSVVFFDSATGGLYFGPMVRNAGYYGVIFFYTLSGFLITYLLLNEKKITGRIALSLFYRRRALRIWPLYYLIILLSFFVFPGLLPMSAANPAGDWGVAIVLYLLFLPNIAALRLYIPTCFHTYTIGYEEQFYLVWPLLLQKSGKRLPGVLLTIFFLPLVLEAFHLYIVAHTSRSPGGLMVWVRAGLTFISFSNIPAFIAGAGGALFYFKGEMLLPTAVGRRMLGFALVFILTGLMYFGEPNALGYVNLISVLFSLLIVTWIAWNPTLRPAGRLLALGGKISYGIYIYHPAVLLFIRAVLPRMPGVSPIAGYLLYLTVSLLLLLPLSYLSYRYFERLFLGMKDRFRPKPVNGRGEVSGGAGTI